MVDFENMIGDVRYERWNGGKNCGLTTGRKGCYCFLVSDVGANSRTCGDWSRQMNFREAHGIQLYQKSEILVLCARR